MPKIPHVSNVARRPAGAASPRLLARRQAQPGTERRGQEPCGRQPTEQGEAPPRQCFFALVAVRAGLAAGKDPGRPRRRHGHGVDGRDDHRHRDGQGELAEELAGDAAEEGAGQQHRAEHQRHGEDRPGDLVHCLDRGFAHGQALVQPALDVLQHDDGVVHDEADGQHQPEERQVVQGEAHQAHDGEGPDQRDCHVDHGQEQGFPVLQEQQDDDGNQDDGLAQRMEHLIHGFADERRGVVDDGVTQPLGEAGFQLPHLGLDAVGGVQGVRVWQQKDDNTRRRPAVQLPERVLVSGPQLGPADVPEVGDFPVRAGLENDVCELLGLDQAAEGAQGVLEILAVGDRRLTDLSGRHLHVLLAQDPDHVVDRQIPRLQLVRVQPDAHAVVLLAEDAHVADALHPGDGVLDMDRGVIAQVERIIIRPAGLRVVLGIQTDPQQDVWGPFLDRHADGPNHVGERRLGDGDAVLHQHLGHVHVGAQLEGHVQGVRCRRCCSATTCTSSLRRQRPAARSARPLCRPLPGRWLRGSWLSPGRSAA